MGGSEADLTVQESAKATLEGIMGAGRNLNGAFLNIHVKGWENHKGINQYDGRISAW